MSERKSPSTGNQPDSPTEPDIILDPEPIALPEEPRPGDPISHERGLADPRHLRPEPADLTPGIGTPLELEALEGPTEASTPPLREDDGPGLMDPRLLKSAFDEQ